MSNIVPIFILGEIRNGTKGLSNSFGKLKNVYTPMHKYHRGSHESYLLENQRLFSKITSIYEYMQFLLLTVNSDYFKILDIPEDILYEKKYRSYYEIFFRIMDEAAKKRNCGYWLTKLSPQFCNYITEFERFKYELNNHYSSAEYICIKRDINSSVQSYLNMRAVKAGRKKHIKRYISALVYTMAYVHNYKIYFKITNENRGINISFEQYINNPELTVKQITQHFKINHEIETNIEKFERNSSYLLNEKKVTVPSWSIKLSLLFSRFLNSLCPGIIKKMGIKRSIHSKWYLGAGFSYRLTAMSKIKDIYLDNIEKNETALYKMIINNHRSREKID